MTADARSTIVVMYGVVQYRSVYKIIKINLRSAMLQNRKKQQLHILHIQIEKISKHEIFI